MSENGSIIRGEIYWTKHKPHRPVVVVSDNDINDITDSVLVVPMTSNPTHDLNTHCAIRVGECSTALAERIRPMKKTDLGKFIDFCSVAEMTQLDFCLINALNLNYLFDEIKDEQVTADQLIPDATKSTPPEQSEPEPEPVRTGRFIQGTVDPAISVIKTGDEIRTKDESLAVAIVEGESEPRVLRESEPRVLRESEVIRSRSVLNQIIDEAVEESVELAAHEQEKEWEIEDPEMGFDRLTDLLDRCVELERELDRSQAREELLMKLYKELLEKMGG